MKSTPGESLPDNGESLPDNKEGIDYDIDNRYSILGMLISKKEPASPYLNSIKEAISGQNRDSGPLEPDEAIKGMLEMVTANKNRISLLKKEIELLEKNTKELEDYIRDF
ncbi:MAG: hypothetical protein WC570_00490 [Patescibacteria group bacterium]